MANISSPSDRTVSTAPQSAAQTYRGPFAIMTVLFFMWGFMTVWNDILIPRFKDAFQLSHFKAMLVQFAFFGAYSVGALVYCLVSMAGGDPINRMGYKNGVIVGLLIAALAARFFTRLRRWRLIRFSWPHCSWSAWDSPCCKLRRTPT